MKNLGTKTIETKRLILRKFSLSDAEDMYKNWASDDKVTKFLTWPTHAELEISRRVIDKWVKDYLDDKKY